MDALKQELESLRQDNLRFLQQIATLIEERNVAIQERNCALAIVNSEQPSPINNEDLAVWINEMAADFALEPFKTDIEMSQFLWGWLPHIRATRQLGIHIQDGDIDE